LGLAVVAGIGGWMAVQGLATVGIIASFITYARQFGRPLSELANLYGAIQSAIAGAERVFAVIDEAPEVDAPDTRPIAQIRGEVIFDDVSFSYGHRDNQGSGPRGQGDRETGRPGDLTATSYQPPA